MSGPYSRVYLSIVDEEFYDNDRALAMFLRGLLAAGLEKERARKYRLPRRAWEAILARFGYRCAYCGRAGELEREHRKPVSRGGLTTTENIVPACRQCNRRKGTQPAEMWPILP